jgi:hypothetical protein
MLNTQESIQEEAKKPYEPPVLSIYGDIIELTAGGKTSEKSDSGSNKMSGS